MKIGGRKPTVVPVLDAAGVKAAGGAKIVDLVGRHDATKGEAMIAFGWAIAEALESGRYAGR